MKFYADLHIHSHYSRATSKDLDVEHLSLWAQKKGIHLIGTGDFVHPAWLQELEEKLEPSYEGFFKLKSSSQGAIVKELPLSCQHEVHFILTVEISSIYKKQGRVRKVHNLVVVPSWKAAHLLQTRLEKIGNIRSDGRPILGLDSRDLLEIVLESDPRSFLIPAHIWTPWFSALGAYGGFDSIESCFGDLTPHIFAVETGLSSDPPMNWRLSQLDPYLMVSHSDAHSPSKLGREATIYDTDFSYEGVYQALRKDSRSGGVIGTLEFFPEEGKYHWDGHRKCQIFWSPQQTQHFQGRCPTCKSPVTVGVLSRVEALADRPLGAKAPRARPYYPLIPLPEILAEVWQVGASSKKVQQEYESLLAQLGNEFFLLFEADLEDIRRSGGSVLAEAIRRMRAGKVKISAGYDGEYGKIQLFGEGERSRFRSQVENSLFKEGEAEEVLSLSSSSLSFIEKLVEPLPSSSQGSLEPKDTLALSQREDTLESLTGLNFTQQQAVTHEGSHLLICAGPGTGKTHTLIQRMIFRLKKIPPPQKILALTFTHKAAQEMRERLPHPRFASRVFLGTFHQFCLQVLQEEGKALKLPSPFSLAGETEQEILAEIAWPEASFRERCKLLEELRQLKNQWWTLESLPPALKIFQETQGDYGFLDCDDLLQKTIQLLLEFPSVREKLQQRYREIFVDEYQDINALQQKLLELLSSSSHFLTVIGDPQQAIYGFRGSDIRFFLEFPQIFAPAKQLFLTENYRNPSLLLQMSQSLLKPSASPPLVAKSSLGGEASLFIAPTARAEAEYVAQEIEKKVGGLSFFSYDSQQVTPDEKRLYSFGEIAVFYRLHTQGLALEEAFQQKGIPYQLAGNKQIPSSLVTFLNLLRWLCSERLLIPQVFSLLQSYCSGWNPIEERLLQDFWKVKKKKTISLFDLLTLSHDAPSLSSEGKSALLTFALQLRDQSSLLKTLPFPEWFFSFVQKSGIRPLEGIREKEGWGILEEAVRESQQMEDLLDHFLLQQVSEPAFRRGEKVSLMTLHTSKGLEFPLVFITGCEKQLLPLQIGAYSSSEEEERRLFYVGMTRTQGELFLSYAQQRFLLGQALEEGPSPFLQELQERFPFLSVQKFRKKGKRKDAQLFLFSEED